MITPPMGIVAQQNNEPAPQCLVVSNWSLAVLGVVAPLAIQRRLQWRLARARAPTALDDLPPQVHGAAYALATSTAVWCALLALA